MTQWQVTTLAQMDYREIYALWHLREKTFVLEQECIYLDADGKDLEAEHVLGFQHDQLVAHARIIWPDNPENPVKFGRVCVDSSCRGQGLGKELVKQTLNHIHNHQNFNGNIEISAQHYLVDFYNELGFTERGEIYLEDGIDHIRMVA